MFKKKRVIPVPIIETESPKVLLLVDWENVFFSLYDPSNPSKGTNITERFPKMMEWIKSDVGELLGGYGFVFAPDRFHIDNIKMCLKN